MPSSYRAALALMATQGGPWLLVLLLAYCTFIRIILGSFGFFDVLTIMTFIFMRGFMEWALHSYIFNAAPLPWVRWRLRNPISSMHGEHHRNPEKVDALFFGWKGIAAVLAATSVFLFLVFRDMGHVLSSLIAVVINLLMYEWCHVVSHSKITPRFPFFAAVIDNHRKHHHVDGDKHMGVSSVLADKVFGTY